MAGLKFFFGLIACVTSAMAADFQLYWSPNPNLQPEFPLFGSQLSGRVYIFSKVNHQFGGATGDMIYRIDNPNSNQKVVQRNAPWIWDALDTTSLSNGPHVVYGKFKRNGGSSAPPPPLGQCGQVCCWQGQECAEQYTCGSECCEKRGICGGYGAGPQCSWSQNSFKTPGQCGAGNNQVFESTDNIMINVYNAQVWVPPTPPPASGVNCGSVNCGEFGMHSKPNPYSIGCQHNPCQPWQCCQNMPAPPTPVPTPIQGGNQVYQCNQFQCRGTPKLFQFAGQGQCGPRFCTEGDCCDATPCSVCAHKYSDWNQQNRCSSVCDGAVLNGPYACQSCTHQLNDLSCNVGCGIGAAVHIQSRNQYAKCSDFCYAAFNGNRGDKDNCKKECTCAIDNRLNQVNSCAKKNFNNPGAYAGCEFAVSFMMSGKNIDKN